MSKSFEVGAYYHTLKEIDVSGIDHATILNAQTNEVRDFQKKHPRLRVAVALDKKGLKTVQEWKGVIQEVTILAHQGMGLEKECATLKEQGFQVRVALPSDIHLLKTFHLGALQGVKLDLMAFDYARPVTGHRTKFHTLLPSVDQTLRFLHDEGVALKQVNLGLSNFGVMFKNVPSGASFSGYNEPCGGEQLDQPELSQQEVDNYLKIHPSAQLFYTSFQGCFQSFIYHEKNGDWISFDDAVTRQSKTEWARRQQLHGVFYMGTLG